MKKNPARYFILLFLTLLVVSSFTQILGVRKVWADWNPAGETTVSIYEVIPAEGRVHVTLSYRLKNSDEKLRGTRNYYSKWTVSVPLEATDIQVYDNNKPVSFNTEIVDSRIHLKLQLNERLRYGMEYSFSVEYDLRTITKSVAVFRAYGKGGGASIVKVILPREYYDDVRLEPSNYTISETDTHTIYSYNVDHDGWRLSIQVGAARKTDYHSLSGAVKLREREVRITVKFWEGEEAKAQRILNLYIAELPILEDITAVAFPGPDHIVVQEVTREDIDGHGGRNMGKDGIVFSYETMESEWGPIHELAHYWAMQPYWKEAWMKEGYAELYTYLTLIKLDKETTAEEAIIRSTTEYQDNKGQFEIPLSLWDTPEVLTEENKLETRFGYSKSFIFIFNLYDTYGEVILRKTNQEVYETSRGVDWFDYLYILENSTGEELGPIFADWVLPEDFGTAFNQWQSAEKSYREMDQAVTERKNTLGIGTVEAELEKGKELIMNGDFDQALSQIQSTAVLFQEWETAEKAVRDAEEAVAQAKAEGRTWRLTNIESTINQAKTLIEKGRLEESMVKSQLAQEKADKTPTPWLAIPTLLAPYFVGVSTLAYWVFGSMVALVLAALILAALVSVKAPKISRDSFRSTFRRSLKISPLAFALILGFVDYLDKAQVGSAVGLAFAGVLLGFGSVLLGFWLLLIVKLLPLRTQFSKDITYGISGSTIGAFVLGPILSIPFAAGLILGLFGSVVSSSAKTGMRNLFRPLGSRSLE